MKRTQRRDLTLARKVGAWMRDLRLEKGLSLAQLHARGAPTPSQMSSLERGKVDFTTDTIARIALALGMRPWQMLADDPELASIDLGEAKRILFANPEFDLPVEPAKPIPGKAKPWHWKNERKQKRKG